MPETRLFKRKLSKTVRSLKRAKGSLAAASKTKTALAPKKQYDDEGKEQITIRGERREIKGFSRLIRAHLDKTAKLVPRVSDPDFKEGGFRAWEAVTD